MIEDKIQIQTGDGVADGILFRPEKEGQWPGVIHFTDIGGIRPSQEDMARRLAAEGYTVLVPNVFIAPGNHRCSTSRETLGMSRR